MLELSPAMQAYEKSLLDELHRAIAIAKEARKQGLDPSLDVEIPIASDLADRVEVLVGVKGVAARIRELEATMSREEAALRIGDDFVARKFGEKDTMEVLDHAIRVAMALLTEGVVSAPTEGIAKVALGKNDDGSQYLMIFYAGPIRSAGGTAQAMSVLVGDYVRQKLGINRYIPRQEEVERYIEEIRQYNSIMNLQYLPSEAEIRIIIENCPVCVDGEATEQEEVSGHRNLERVETNAVRGGMALVIGEGIAGQGPEAQGPGREDEDAGLGLARQAYRGGGKERGRREDRGYQAARQVPPRSYRRPAGLCVPDEKGRVPAPVRAEPEHRVCRSRHAPGHPLRPRGVPCHRHPDEDRAAG